jgi:nuclear pore complex protein Nup121
MEGESQIHRDGQETKKKCHESSGSSCSTSGPLLLHECSVSLPQKPVSMKRSLASEISDDILNKKARMYSRRSPPSKFTRGSPVTKHNSIRSSYRSTQGISHLGRRGIPPHPSWLDQLPQAPSGPRGHQRTQKKRSCVMDPVLPLLLLGWLTRSPMAPSSQGRQQRTQEKRSWAMDLVLLFLLLG